MAVSMSKSSITRPRPVPRMTAARGVRSSLAFIKAAALAACSNVGDKDGWAMVGMPFYPLCLMFLCLRLILE